MMVDEVEAIKNTFASVRILQDESMIDKVLQKIGHVKTSKYNPTHHHPSPHRCSMKAFLLSMLLHPRSKLEQYQLSSFKRQKRLKYLQTGNNIVQKTLN